MSNQHSQLQALLTDVILPNLQEIHASQVEQRFQTDCLNQNLEDFREEIELRFAELRAELAACRQQLEDTMVTLRETETATELPSTPNDKKTLIH
jgi:hypothetical protein